MNRRTFVRALAGAAALAARAGAATARDGKPKVVLFGMTAFALRDGKITAFMPANHGHSAFLLGRPAFLKGLVGSATNAGQSGITQVHKGLPGELGATCVGGKQIDIGSGAASIADSLQQRLPSITTLATDIDGVKKTLKTSFDAGSVTLTLGGGTLREGDPSTCAKGELKRIRWQFYADGKAIGKPGSVTDVAVFESEGDEMTITIGAAASKLPTDTTIWIFNLPLAKLEDKTPEIIEDAHHWFDLVEPKPSAKQLRARTGDTVERDKGKPFSHPCRGSLLPAQKDYLETLEDQAKREGRRILYIPPDSDPCFMVAE